MNTISLGHMFAKASVAAMVAVVMLADAVSAQAEIPAKVVSQDVSIEQRLDSLIPLGIAFKDEAGNDVQLGRYFGKRPVILTLSYLECPMLCTQVLNGLVSAMRTLKFDAGNEYEVITVSIDHRETPTLAAAKKRQYVRDYGRAGAENGWHFLTGDSLAIKRLADAVGFRFVYDPKSKQFAHASGIMIATPQGRLSRYLYGIEYPPRDVRFSLIEAGENKIGSITDKVMMLCFEYNPVTGQYGVAIMAIVRTAAVVTVVAMIGFIVLSVRRDRRRRLLDNAVHIAGSRN